MNYLGFKQTVASVNSITIADVNTEITKQKAVANGLATLDGSGKVPSAQLPSYVDDVVEYNALASFPATGEAGKIYVDTSTNLSYRWSGSQYSKITDGGVDSVNDRKGAVTLSKSDVGLSNVDNTADANKTVASAVTLTQVLPVNLGGTGANTASQARSNLGFGNAKINNTLFDGVASVLINRYSSFIGVSAGTTYNATVVDSEAFIQVGDNTTINLPSSGLAPRTSFTIIHAGTGADSYVNVSGSQFIYYPPTGLASTSAKQLVLKAGETVEIFYRGGSEFDVIAGSYIVRTLLQNIATNSIKAGTASYKKGWRGNTVTLPSSAGEVVIAHGVASLEMVQGKCTDSDGFEVWNNDVDPARQFYIRAKGGNLYVGVTANSSKVFGKTVDLFIGEKL